jgi:hypothetical protein
MRRWIPLAMIASVTLTAWGQAPSGARLQGEEKLRWVCERLDLNEEQEEQVEALLAAYNAQIKYYEENAVELLERVRDKYAELQKARADNDEEAVERLQRELQNLSPNRAAEITFYDALVQHLDENQMLELADLLEEVGEVRKQPEKPQGGSASATGGGEVREMTRIYPKDPPDQPQEPAQAEADAEATQAPKPNKLRPYHVFHTAMAQELSVKQLRQLEEVLNRFRNEARMSPTRDLASIQARVQQMIEAVRPILESSQQETFDKVLADLAVNAEPPKPLTSGGTAPEGMPLQRGPGPRP